ncbi:MAG: hypothetical protein IPP39_09255 [Chitinophagaceae bacterium]|nr:hypothetical protein [Chitinophagaceae bacterium]
MSDEQNKDSPKSTSDNKQQEHQLNPPAIDKSIVQAEANTEAEKPTTYNPQLTTQEDMEVHHHSHNSHGKKNWKSYFWEFLMLFLAVFCGFLAEYQLEHKIEKERARKYMYDMVENLKYDTTRYNRNLVNNETIGKQLDSFRATISVAIKGQINGNRLYELWLKCSSFNSVVFNRTAITQLKNAGSFRLIKNDILSSSISDYYERKITACEEQEEQLRRSNERLSISSARFFNYEPFDQLLSKETTFKELTPDSIIKNNYQIFNSNPALTLLNSNPADLKLLYNDVAIKENEMKAYNAYLRWAKETAIALMQEIDKEYHFKK